MAELSTDTIRTLMNTYCQDLTVEQKKPVRTVLRGKNVFISGGAGTGKSYVLTAMIEALKGAGKNVVVCAPTGVAALNIGGVTLHKVFNLKAEICINSNGKLITHAPKVIQSADVVIIDEISMVRIDLFDSVISGIKKAERKTGKKIQVVVCGDFFQLAPVIQSNSKDRDILERYYGRDIGLAFAFQGDEWANCHFTSFTLTRSFRQDNNSEFLENLNKIRIGDVSAISYFNSHANPYTIKNAPHLAFSNINVNRINAECLRKIPGETITLKAEYLGDATPGTDIPDEIVVKKGARVILTINDRYDHPDVCSLKYQCGLIKKEDPEPFFQNGTVAQISEYYGEDNLCLNIDEKPQILLHRHTYPVYAYKVNSSGKIEREQIGAIKQYPVQLGYAITIHKAQGQTYSAINLDPSTYDRAVSGLIYVALSRIRSIEGLHLSRNLHADDIYVHQDVLDFYQGKFKRQKGRPRKYIDSKVVSVPVELKKHIVHEIVMNAPLPMNNVSMKKSGKRAKIRVPTNLLEHVKTEMREWRKNVSK